MGDVRDRGQDLAIRPMKVLDLRAVSRIEDSSFSDPWPMSTFLAELRFGNPSYYLVATDGKSGNIVAYIGAWLILEEIHITTLAVEAAYRRRGIATRLLGALLELVYPAGGRVITLEVRPSNEAARFFYEMLGFQVLGRRVRYYGDEDALIMTAGKKEVARLKNIL